MLGDIVSSRSHETYGMDARVVQFEMLKEFILEEYYRPAQMEGLKLYQMERPDRKIVLQYQKLRDFFSPLSQQMHFP